MIPHYSDTIVFVVITAIVSDGIFAAVLDIDAVIIEIALIVGNEVVVATDIKVDAVAVSAVTAFIVGDDVVIAAP